MEAENSYQIFDMCYGVISDRSRIGAYVILENGEKAFAKRCSNLREGTSVLCSVLKLEKPDKGWLKLVSVDSVLYPSPLAA